MEHCVYATRFARTYIDTNHISLNYNYILMCANSSLASHREKAKRDFEKKQHENQNSISRSF